MNWVKSRYDAWKKNAYFTVKGVGTGSLNFLQFIENYIFLYFSCYLNYYNPFPVPNLLPDIYFFCGEGGGLIRCIISTKKTSQKKLPCLIDVSNFVSFFYLKYENIFQVRSKPGFSFYFIVQEKHVWQITNIVIKMHILASIIL